MSFRVLGTLSSSWVPGMPGWVLVCSQQIPVRHFITRYSSPSCLSVRTIIFKCWKRNLGLGKRSCWSILPLSVSPHHLTMCDCVHDGASTCLKWFPPSSPSLRLPNAPGSRMDGEASIGQRTFKLIARPCLLGQSLIPSLSEFVLCWDFRSKPPCQNSSRGNLKSPNKKVRGYWR